MIRHLPLVTYRRAAWKNGLGFTDEIAIYPEGASLARGDFLWRVSSARIERSSPFSAFPHHDRVLVVLNGAGVRLSHQIAAGEPPDVVELPVLEPYDFPGDVPTQCELLGGPIRDLSVFVRKGEAHAEVEVLRIAAGESLQWGCPGGVGFLLVVQGELEVIGRDTVLKAPIGDSLRVDDELVTLSCGDSAAVWVAVKLTT
jgi:environmental stress-induced protein Ves